VDEMMQKQIEQLSPSCQWSSERNTTVRPWQGQKDNFSKTPKLWGWLECW